MAEKLDGKWTTHQWLKKALLLFFRLRDSAPMDVAAGAYDKVPLKFTGGLAGALAGRPIMIRYVDNRDLGKQSGTQ